MDAGYSIALEKQLEILRAERIKLQRHPDLERSARDISGDLGYPEEEFREALRHAPGWHRGSLKALSLGVTFYWARPICETLEHIITEMPDWLLTAEALPAKHGFFWFEQPLRATESDSHGPVMAISWTMLARTADGWRLPLEPVEPSEFPSLEWSPFFNFWGLLKDVETRSPLIPIDDVDGVLWIFGDSYRDTLKRLSDLDNRPRQAKLRYLAVALAFLQQKIWIPEAMPADRATRRRWDRIAGEKPEPVVSVIRLRHVERSPKEPEGQASPVDWSCQWIVRGHWRSQWYPSLTRHQAKWIDPYVKGPEGRPLKPSRATVYAVVR